MTTLSLQVYADKTFNNIKILNNLLISATATITINGTLTITGTVTISGNMTISGNITSTGTNTWSGSNTFSGTTTFNTDPLIRRVDNTTARTLNFRTGSGNDWLLGQGAGSSSLSLTQANAGVNANFLLQLGTGVMSVTGGNASNPTIGVTFGFSTVGTTGGHIYSGTILAVAGGTPRTLNTFAGVVPFTGIADIIADASGTVVINNSLCTASTLGIVTLLTTTAAAGSTPRVESVTFGVGTITIVIRNSDPATATGIAAYTFAFQLFQL